MTAIYASNHIDMLLCRVSSFRHLLMGLAESEDTLLTDISGWSEGSTGMLTGFDSVAWSVIDVLELRFCEVCACSSVLWTVCSLATAATNPSPPTFTNGPWSMDESGELWWPVSGAWKRLEPKWNYKRFNRARLNPFRRPTNRVEIEHHPLNANISY